MYIEELKGMFNNNTKIIAKQDNYKSTLWLADVKGFYERYQYNLGYKRKNSKKPRVNRPSIIIDKQGKYYRIFFLSASGKGYSFDIENCKYMYCNKPFLWKSNSRIFIKSIKEKRIKFIFLLHEDDLKNLMDFCAPCNDEYIQNIANKRQRCLMRF